MDPISQLEPATRSSLHGDILSHNCRHLRADDDLQSLARFTRCSKLFYNTSIKVLYKNIHIFHPHSYDQLLSGLGDNAATEDSGRRIRQLSFCTRLSIYSWPDRSALEYLKSLVARTHNDPIFPNVKYLDFHIEESAATDERRTRSGAALYARYNAAFYFGMLLAPDHVCVHPTSAGHHRLIDALARGWSHRVKSANYHAYIGPTPGALFTAEASRLFYAANDLRNLPSGLQVFWSRS